MFTLNSTKSIGSTVNEVALAILLCLWSDAAAAHTTINMPWVFADAMVLQQGVPIPVWGKAEPGQSVLVEIAGQSQASRVHADGTWRVVLNAMEPCDQPSDMFITIGNESRVIRGILVGEVWLLAGQSNMDFALGSSTGGSEWAGKLASSPLIRWIDPQPAISMGRHAWPLSVCQNLKPSQYFQSAKWMHGDRQDAARFSAVGSIFGVKLHEHLKRPIGLIDVSVGGSPTESWVSREHVLADPALAPLELDFLDTALVQDFIHTRAREHLAQWLMAGRPGELAEHPYRPGFLFEAVFGSIAPFPIAGVLWYQGESNAEDISLHQKLWTQAVEDWRSCMENPDLPVLAVQLPELNRESWTEFREAQQQLVSRVRHTALAITIGSGDRVDVHPRNKAPVGDRLARIALRKVYDRELVCDGPTLREQQLVGNSIQLRFDNDDGGLDIRSQDDRGEGADQGTCFWIAGEDRVFYPASFQKIQGNTIRLISPEVRDPVAIRYAWEADVTPTLFNGEGLPAAPFRTDDWQPIRVACVGDSITFGTGTANPDSDSYPSQLSQLVGPLFDVRRFAVPGASVVNGVKQDRTGWDRGFILQRAFERSIIFDPDIVIINLGINDIVNESFNIDDFVADYVALIRAYQKRPQQPRVMIWNKLSPLFPGQAYYESERLLMIEEGLRRVVEQTDVEIIDMHAPLKNSGQCFPDHLHPNREGARRIAEVTRDKLKELKFPVAGEQP